MIPIVSPNTGDVTDFRYVMAENTKEEILGKRDYADKVLGKMYGSLIDKQQSPINNTKVMELLKDSYDNNVLSDPERYVEISNDSDNAEYKEIWRLLPDSAKEDIKRIWPDGKMYIRDDLVRLVFGFRKISVTDKLNGWLEKNKYTPLHRYMSNTMKISGHIWQAIVQTAKQNIVIFTPKVLISNVMSNQLLLNMKGVPIAYAAKTQFKAVKWTNEYMDALTKKSDLEQENLAYPNNANYKRNELKMARIDKDLEASPIHYLVQKGVFQNLMEDIRGGEDGANKIAAAVAGLSPTLEAMGNAGANMIPAPVKSAYNQLTIAPGTNLNRILTHATQYSDFVSRVTLFMYETEVKGKSELASFREAMDTFVNYDIPTSAGLQYANDMGMLMFTKFFFRIQRIIAKTFKDAPATAMMGFGAQSFILELPDISDSMIGVGTFMSHTGDVDIIGDAFQFTALNQFTWFTPWNWF